MAEKKSLGIHILRIFIDRTRSRIVPPKNTLFQVFFQDIIISDLRRLSFNNDYTIIINPVINGYFLKISVNFGFKIFFTVRSIFLINHIMLYIKGIFLTGFLLSHHCSSNQINHGKAAKKLPAYLA
jgi:hypothetical protein